MTTSDNTRTHTARRAFEDEGMTIEYVGWHHGIGHWRVLYGAPEPTVIASELRADQLWPWLIGWKAACSVFAPVKSI